MNSCTKTGILEACLSANLTSCKDLDRATKIAETMVAGNRRHGVHRAKPVMPGNIINNENTTLKIDNLTHACCR